MTGAKENLLGLIGRPVKHSFSKDYFSAKFLELNLENFKYELFELKFIEDLELLLAKYPQLVGLNVTLPYKKAVIPYLSSLSDEAQRVGAVNTIKIGPSGLLRGFNTDYYGFKISLVHWLDEFKPHKCLILGTGGAAAAVNAVLKDLGIDLLMVSRTATASAISYDNLKEKDLEEYPLIINTTPLGMSPEVASLPDLSYDQISSSHYVYDLVYNPMVTTLMKTAALRGAQVKNGLEMLQLQAEKAWEIWTS